MAETIHKQEDVDEEVGNESKKKEAENESKKKETENEEKSTDQNNSKTSLNEESNENIIEKPSEDITKEPEKKEEKHVFAMPSFLPSSNKASDNRLPVKKEETKTKTSFGLEEPAWGGIAECSDPPYSLTILKDGIVKDMVDLSKKSRYIFGRNHDCDIQIEHPSCSRYHAVLQYCVVEKDLRKRGFYVYDTGSTHGTILNKVKVKPKVYNRVRVGYQLKFGGSTRLYIIEVHDINWKLCSFFSCFFFCCFV